MSAESASKESYKIAPLILAGPSGVGKGTLINKLFQKYPDNFEYSISHTSRPQRPGDQNCVHYFFVSEEEFRKLINESFFIEYAVINGHFYGTSKNELERIRSSKRIALLELDVQGVIQIMKANIGVPINYVFIRPPSIDDLRLRLIKRQTESKEDIERRLKTAEMELQLAEALQFNCFLVNENLAICFDALCTFVDKNYVFLKSVGEVKE